MNTRNIPNNILADRVAELEMKLAKTEWLSQEENISDNEPYIPFYGDVTQLNTKRTILDNVGKETLQNLTSELMDLLDTSVAIYEKNGDYAYGVFNSGWCQLLDASSRKLCNTDDNKIALNCGKWLCHEDCWNNSAKAAINIKKSTDIDCIGDIKLYAEPIFVGDEVIGVINIGYGNPPTDNKTLQDLSEKFSIDFDILKQKAQAYKPRPDFIINIAKKRLKSTAKLIGEIVNRKKTEFKLNERIKELNCISKLSELVEKFDNIDDILSELVYILKQSWQFPNITEVQITNNGYSYQTKNYKETEWKMSSDLISDNIKSGKINIVYLKNPNKFSDPFLKEEYKLLKLISERTGKIKERLEKNKRYKELFNTIYEAILKADKNGIITKANQTAADLCGYDNPDDLIGRPMTDLYSTPDIRGKIIEKLDQEGGLFNNFEFLLKKKDGTLVTTLCNIRMLYNRKNEFIGTLGALRDASDLKKTENELQTKNEEYEAINEELRQTNDELIKAKKYAEESSAKLNTIFNMSQSFICIADVNTANFKFVNPTFKRILDYTEKELINKPFYDFIHPDDIKPTVEVVEKQLKAGKAVVSFENRYRCKNGEYVWLNWNSFPIPEKGVTYAIAHDITDRKLMQEELIAKNKEYEALNEELRQTNEELFIAKQRAEESEEELNLTLDATTDGIWKWNFVSNELFFSPNYYKMLGYEPYEFEANFENWAALIHPNDKEKAMKTAKKWLEKKDTNYENTFRLKTKNNDYLWLISTGKIVERNECGNAVRMIGNHINITPVKKAQREINKHQKEFQTWIQNTPICTKKIDLDFNLQFMSEAGIRELKVSDVNKFYGAPYPFYFFPEEFQEAMLKTMKQVRETCEIMQIDGILSDTEGKKMWYNHILVPVKNIEGKLDYILILSSDISDRKLAEQELQAKNEEYEVLNEELRQTNEELFETKENTDIQNIKIKHFYQAAKDVLNIDDFTTTAKKLFESCKELTGATSGYVALLNDKGEENEVLFLDSGGLPCTVDESLPMPIRGLRGIAYKLTKAVYHNDFMNSEHIKFMPEGHVVLKNVMFAPLIINKKAVGLIGLANKPTDFNDKDLEVVSTFGELASISLRNSRNYDALINAKERAEESDRLKSAFLQNLSHEIRTPLNAICGFSGMLSKPQITNNKRNSFVAIVQESSNQLLSIVSDILTISSLETKQEKVYNEKVCINNIILEMLSIFKQQSSNRNISLYTKQPLTDKQSEIYTDKTKITQILSNLLSNALKFTHEGNISFGYELIPDPKATDNTSSVIKFYVQDSGIGIKPELQDKIFERFRQADLSMNRKYGGTGLGLAISKSFVELLGGKIWVNSEPEKGSTFYFTIPYKPVNEDEIVVSVNKPGETYNKPTILVAEDEEFNFLYIEEILIDSDCTTIHAKDGQEAVEIAKNQDISLILMDIKMPVMDGHTAAKIIKEQKPDLPIVAQSAYALEHEIKKFNDIFDDYLPKPIKEEQLMGKVNKYIRSKT